MTFFEKNIYMFLPLSYLYIHVSLYVFILDPEVSSKARERLIRIAAQADNEETDGIFILLIHRSELKAPGIWHPSRPTIKIVGLLCSYLSAQNRPYKKYILPF